MAFLARVLGGFAAAGVGGFIFTKYSSEKDNPNVKSYFARSESPKKEQQPLNFTIKVPESNRSNEMGTKIGIGAVIITGVAVIC